MRLVLLQAHPHLPLFSYSQAIVFATQIKSQVGPALFSLPSRPAQMHLGGEVLPLQITPTVPGTESVLGRKEGSGSEEDFRTFRFDLSGIGTSRRWRCVSMGASKSGQSGGEIL